MAYISLATDIRNHLEAEHDWRPPSTGPTPDFYEAHRALHKAYRAALEEAIRLHQEFEVGGHLHLFLE